MPQAAPIGHPEARRSPPLTPKISVESDLRPFGYPRSLNRYCDLGWETRFQRLRAPPEVGASRPGLPAPTIPGLFSALARKLMVGDLPPDENTYLANR
jgi:hypothetical protein